MAIVTLNHPVETVLPTRVRRITKNIQIIQIIDNNHPITTEMEIVHDNLSHVTAIGISETT